MFVLSLLIVGFMGWLIYRLLHPTNLEISPASVALMWILGIGGLYLIYYLFISILKQNPPPLLIVIIAVIGCIDMMRSRQYISLTGWQIFQQEKWATLGLIVVVIIMSINIFMSGFYADTTRMWLAKGDMLNQLPDYIPLIESLEEYVHPDYPMIMSHQYQWQLVWGDDLINLKLSTWVWYIMILLASMGLLTEWTKHPVRWLILLAGFPGYWFVVPLATVDIPLSVMWVVAVSWMLRHLNQNTGSSIAIAVVCGVMTLTKNEGILMVACLLMGLAVIFILRPIQRKQITRLIGMIVVVCAICFFSWYGLIIGQATISVGSDFGLSGFRWERILEVTQLLLPLIFNPLSTAWLWLIFIGFILLGYREKPLVWLPVALYLLLISSSYLFSVRPTSLYEHIVQSYFRLILQITPMALIYVARCFSYDKT